MFLQLSRNAKKAHVSHSDTEAAILLQAIKIHLDFICGQKMQEKPLQLDPELPGSAGPL